MIANGLSFAAELHTHGNDPLSLFDAGIVIRQLSYSEFVFPHGPVHTTLDEQYIPGSSFRILPKVYVEAYTQLITRAG